MKFCQRAFVLILLNLTVCGRTTFAGPGTFDPTFVPTLNGAVYAIGTQPDGRIIIGGNFTTINSTTRTRIARIFPDGSVDNSFQNVGGVTGASGGASSTVNALVVQPDGKILIAGEFFTVNNVSRNHVARLNPDGSIDTGFVPNFTSTSLSIYAVAVQPDNKVIIGGNFISLGTNRNYIARLNADGTLDSSFNAGAGANNPVFSVALQPDGKILMGGAFTTVFGIQRNRLARLLSDGTLDLNFMNGQNGPSGNVRSILVQGDGKILIGGEFTSVNVSSRNRMARLNSDGTTDLNTFTSTGPSGSVYAMTVQNDGDVVMVGDFTAYNSFSRSRVARSFSDGTFDASFMTNSTGANILVRSVALQSDGKVLIGGDFTTLNGTNRAFLARLYGDVYPPEIVTQPVSRNTSVGSNITFSVNVNNPTPVNYQWRRDGFNIPGATLNAYTLFNVQTNDSGIYSVYLSSGAGALASSNAVLNVGIPPAIFAQPSNITVLAGQTTNFSVGATGWPLNYQWRKAGQVIPGATNASLVFGNVVSTNAGSYTVTITNFLGTNISASVSLTVLVPASITAQPTNRIVGEGSNTTFTVTATGTALTYQWLKDGNEILGANAASYSITDAQLGQQGDYRVIVTNSYASVTSQVATLTVLRYAPAIVTQPQSRNVSVGSDVTFDVVASGTTLSYQWRKDDLEIFGATGSSYALTNVTEAQAGAFTVVVTNFVGSVTSSIATLNIGHAPVLTSSPVSQSNSIGATIVFSGSVTGSLPMQLQWLKDGAPIISETNSSLIISNVQPGNIGYYQLAATNSFGSATSTNAALELTGYNFWEWAGLVAYYPFNGNAVDESGHGYDGLASFVQTAPDRFAQTDKAFSFLGTGGSNVKLTNATAFSFDADFTISCWFKFLGGSDNPRIFSTSGYELGTETTSASRRIYLNNAGLTLYSSVEFPEQTWLHVVGIRKANVLSLFVNGVKQGEIAVTNPSDYSSAFIPEIGGNSGNGLDAFGGTIDDVRAYRRGFATNEVNLLYALETDTPLISQQPLAQIIFENGTANFNVVAAANHPLTYQWRKNGNSIGGATASNYSVTNAQVAATGAYSVEISNGLIAIVSSEATLTVNPALSLKSGDGNFGFVSNQFGFNVAGPSGQTIVVETSTNLIQWEPIYTNTLSTNGFYYLDATPGDASQKYFRLRGL